jgi:very-short-patch-repair endonuclease
MAAVRLRPLFTGAWSEDRHGRTRLELARFGYRVIRFWNNEVMHKLTGVLEAIRREMDAQ